MSENSPNHDISFRLATKRDLIALQNLFVDTITAVCQKDYTPEQIKAWTSSVEKTKRWHDLLQDQHVIIAQINEKIVGFASLKDNHYIDFFYVHKDYQGQGVAKRLYREIEKEAMAGGTDSLSSDISITAKPFFESRGFVLIKKQDISVRGEVLVNFKMTKKLMP